MSMTLEQAIRILHPDTTLLALAEAEYYGGFNGEDKRIEACETACILACEVMQREVERQADHSGEANGMVSNADKIRNMSDEELAKIITAEPMAAVIPFCKNLPQCEIDLDSPDGIPQERCVQCALDWLRQPAKEETE